MKIATITFLMVILTFAAPLASAHDALDTTMLNTSFEVNAGQPTVPEIEVLQSAVQIPDGYITPRNQNHMANCWEGSFNSGCALNVSSMLLSYYGVYVTPDQLYYRWGGCWAYWYDLPTIAAQHGVQLRVVADGSYTGPDWSLFDSYLNQGIPVIAGGDKMLFNGPHWVLIYRKVGNDYRILDPHIGGERWLSELGPVQHYKIIEGPVLSDLSAPTPPLNQPPVAEADYATTAHGAAVAIAVLANDYDPDGDTLVIEDVTQPDNGSVEIVGETILYTPNPGFVGTDTFSYTISDGQGGTDSAPVTVVVEPDCSVAQPSVAVLWPPNHQLVPVTIQGIVGPNGDSMNITITGIRQNEPINATGDGSTAPDADGIGTSTALLRAERAGNGSGRIYYVAFTAAHEQAGSCSGEVIVTVPHNMGGGSEVVAGDGPLYDSTQPGNEPISGDEPVDDEPVDDEPVDDEPVDDEPVDDEPVDDEPVDDEPVDDEPVDDEPVDDEPVDDEPVDDEPVDDEPVDDEPVNDEPVDDD